MAGPHADDKKSGSAYCTRRETAAVHTACDRSQRQCILSNARDEDLDSASYNIQRIRSRRTSCSEFI